MVKNQRENLRICHSSVKYDPRKYSACENFNKIKYSARNGDHIRTNRQQSAQLIVQTGQLARSNHKFAMFRHGSEQVRTWDSNTPGPDGIYSICLQKGLDLIIKYLILVYRGSIAMDHIPEP